MTTTITPLGLRIEPSTDITGGFMYWRPGDDSLTPRHELAERIVSHVIDSDPLDLEPTSSLFIEGRL